jgi:hypothetical protein
LSLWGPKAQTTYAYKGRNAWRTWTDLGLRMVADGAPFEVRSTRTSYKDPIRAVVHSPNGDVRLPKRATKSWAGLSKFVTLEIDPKKAGKPTTTLTRRVCLNDYSTQRVRPDAPARSPYPVGCWYNPYTLGSVQGVQQGWAVSLLGEGAPLRIGPGHYTVTASISPMYADALGLTSAQSTRKIKLTVKRERGANQRPSAKAAPRSIVARPAAHRPTGAQGAPDDGPTPDLRSLPAWGISLSKNTNFLRFSATVWNAGDSPLVVDGFRRPNQALMDAYQYFFDADGNQTDYQAVGHMHWDPTPSHHHWHFEDFARYSLLDSNKNEVVRSKKEAFCLANTDAVDLTVPDAAWRPENTQLETSCGDRTSLSIREVLAAGWGDTYTQYRAGQSFGIRNLPNGVYYISVNANPGVNLVESSTTNNRSLRKIRLAGKPGHRRVIVPQIGIVKESYGGQG